MPKHVAIPGNVHHSRIPARCSVSEICIKTHTFRWQILCYSYHGCCYNQYIIQHMHVFYGILIF